MQEGGVVSPDFQPYPQPHASTSDTPLPPIKDMWPVQPRSKKRKTQSQAAAAAAVPPAVPSTAGLYDPHTAPAALYTAQAMYSNTSQPVPTYYMDGRPVTVSYNQTEHEDIQEMHITEVEQHSPDYIDYSRLGPSVKELVVDGQALLSGLGTVLAQMRSKCLPPEDKSGDKNSSSEVCQLQIDGLPLSQLFQSFLPHLQNGSGQKMLEQYQQLSSQLSREKCMSLLQTMQQQQLQQQQQQQAILHNEAPAAPLGHPPAERAREEASLVDLHETAETLINFAKYPVEKKAVVVEMIPQTSETNQPRDPNYGRQAGSSAPPAGFTPTSAVEPFPMEHFEFTKEDKELMEECSAALSPSETESIDKLVADTFENVEKTKFISDEVAAAIPEIQKKFLVRRKTALSSTSLRKRSSVTRQVQMNDQKM